MVVSDLEVEVKANLTLCMKHDEEFSEVLETARWLLKQSKL